MSRTTYREVLFRASSFLESQGKEGHAILYVFLAWKGWTQTQWLIHMGEEISSGEERKIQADLQQLMEDYPAQYIIGSEEFFGQTFQVNEATLIPRPETEELVALCLRESQSWKYQPLRVVDVGTGTGAIAVTLKRHCPKWQISAVDISAAALAVARQNAEKLQAEISFYLGNTLEPIGHKINLLISNPPYVSRQEWQEMDASVRKYEPKVALFAENAGLAIYQKMAQEAQEKLAGDGKIFMEIGFHQGKEVKKIYQTTFPEKKVEIRQDMTGQDRFLLVY